MSTISAVSAWLYLPFVLIVFYVFLADRTNGRAIATLLRLSSSSSVCQWRYVLWL